MREGGTEQNVDESLIMHGFASSEIVPLENAIAQTCWTGARDVLVGILGGAMSPLLEPLKQAAKGGFEGSVIGGEIRNCFPMIESRNAAHIRECGYLLSPNACSR